MALGKLLCLRHLMFVTFFPVWTQFLTTSSVQPYQTEQPAKKSEECKFAAKICSKASSELRADISQALTQAAKEYSLDPALIYAVIHSESRCKPKARSHKGAIGLMQLHPNTAKYLGIENPFEVEENIRGGASYLAYLLREFKGNTSLALAAYNAGPGAVKKYKNIPPYRETKNYVRAVLKTYRNLVESQGEIKA